MSLMRVLDHHPAGGRYRLLRLHAPEAARAYRPGQFFMLRVSPIGAGDGGDRLSSDPLLGRPFSLFQRSISEGWIEILYQVAGRGTALMAGWTPGLMVESSGPFGNGFDLNDDGDDFLLVGGGVGIPPLLTVADELVGRSPRPRCRLTLGARTRSDLVYREIAGVEIITATEDGSTGAKGLVTNALDEILRGEIGSLRTKQRIFACGPNSMLRAVHHLANAAGVMCRVSLENRMGCARGVCLGCVVPAVAGALKKYPRVCTEGPVFDSRELDWDSPHWPVP